ncbi:hypothetical protein NDU88_001186 [Pleurodeles waltl]|uniref:Reverse transcriptase RNase H-like domain-containing protein n=1 Tax=Pleurodeles waltl TaxID=8319 RepID=A0AAV7S7W5_PLEWA|nr:hypothetical protein NDU88_001186 [Pleurodeles waltl]
MVMYCGCFIRNMTNLTAPLRELTKINTFWSWGPEQEKGISSNETGLVADTSLVYFDLDRESELFVAASATRLAAVLSQQQNNREWVPVAHASRMLTDTEQRCSHIKKRGHGRVLGCRYFHIYLYGQLFTVHTDHKPLIPLSAPEAEREVHPGLAASEATAQRQKAAARSAEADNRSTRPRSGVFCSCWQSASFSRAAQILSVGGNGRQGYQCKRQ